MGVANMRSGVSNICMTRCRYGGCDL